jgi:23S rRNA-/tRNA-specific pseudouridylate synthase
MDLGAASLPFAVLFEDGDLFALHKPCRLHSVRLGERGGPSVAEHLLETVSELGEVSDRPEDAGLGQRLDYETTGVLIGAKSREMWHALRSSLESHECTKTYLCITDGIISGETWQVSGFIGNRHRGSTKADFSSYEKPRYLPSETDFRLIAADSPTNTMLLGAMLRSGRRHQIRVSAARLGSPLLGDSVYGSDRACEQVCGSSRPFFLHAHEVRFSHPRTGRSMTIVAPLSSMERETLAQRYGPLQSVDAGI